MKMKRNSKLNVVNTMSRIIRRKEEGGSEIVQTVIVLGFAVGLGAALMLLQGDFTTAIDNAGDAVISTFTDMSEFTPTS